MAQRRHSARRIKQRRTYDVREAAKATGATPGTLRHWHKKGREAVTGHWPLIFRGVDIIAFFKIRNAKRKQRCGPGRIYCLRCKAPKTPALGMVDYVPRRTCGAFWKPSAPIAAALCIASHRTPIW